MQTESVQRRAAALAAAACVLWLQHAPAQQAGPDAPGLGGPPAILTQPSAQNADYGANVAFAVEATGADLSYQWRKDGADLADYGNVYGANSAALTMVGVAQIDVAGYNVVVRNPAGAVTSAVARLTVNSITVFSDDFESGDLTNWLAFSELPGLARALRQDPASRKLAPISLAALSPQATRLTSSAGQNRTPGGVRSALVTNSRDKMYRNLGTKLAGRAKATFWIYDDGGRQTRCYGELRGHTGAGHGLYVSPGGMKQLLAIGRYTVQFGTNHTGTLVGETVNTQKYQGKVERGRNAGWFNLSDGPDRSVGWHRFEIEREADGTTIHFYVDGVLGRTITDADHVLLDCVTIGSIGGGTAVGDAWLDDVKVEAFPWRFDWQSKDSERKGLPDWMQLRETGTDPRVTDIGQITTVSEAAGVAASRRAGRWASDGQGLHALDMRGCVEYVLNAPADDAYRLEVEGRERDGQRPGVKLPLMLWMDGEYLGRFILPYSGPTNGAIHCFTPFLKAGPHTIRIYWDNVQSRCSLYLRAVRLQSLFGADLNHNGIKDWVENRLLAQSGVEFAPAASATSPVCLEGRGQYLSLMQCRAGVSPDRMQAVAVQPGAGHRWYADVPLSPGGVTRVEIAHQNGALQETADIAWEITNLLEARDLTVRKGDALLLTALPRAQTAGAIEITVAGVANYTTDAATPIAHRFDRAGVFTVSGRHVPTGAARSLTVTVVEASFDGPVAAWAAKRRFWDCAHLPPQVVIEADPRLRMAQVPAAERLLQKPTPPPLGPNGRQYSLTNDAAEARHVVARLGDKGPILARTVVEGFRLFNYYDTYLRYVHIYPDGSQLIEEAFVLSPVLSTVRVEVRLIVSGVTFEDGTVTKTLAAADFDDMGVCRLRYVRADGVQTSVCHTTKAYQGDALIGWPAYEK